MKQKEHYRKQKNPCDKSQKHFYKYTHIHATPSVDTDSPWNQSVRSTLQGMEQMEKIR